MYLHSIKQECTCIQLSRTVLSCLLPTYLFLGFSIYRKCLHAYQIESHCSYSMSRSHIPAELNIPPGWKKITFAATVWSHSLLFCRTFVFSLLTKGRPSPLHIVLSAVIFCSVNGFLQGHYMLHCTQYHTEWHRDTRFITGTWCYLQTIRSFGPTLY